MINAYAFLGPEGTFCHQAAVEHLKKIEEHALSGLPQGSIRKVVECVATGQAKFGFIPIENNLEGVVYPSLDSLFEAKDSGIAVCGEIILPIRQNLIGLPSSRTRLHEVRAILTHPKAYEQCMTTLEKLWPNGVPPLHAFSSTAQAVEAVATANDPLLVAIGSSQAAEDTNSNLEILVKDIQSEKRNKTRFLVLSQDDCVPTSNDRTFIMFACNPGRPGSLIEILEPLAVNGLNLSFIASREIEFGTYRFSLEFNEHHLSRSGAASLQAMEQNCEWLHVFGSFPESPVRHQLYED